MAFGMAAAGVCVCVCVCVWGPILTGFRSPGVVECRGCPLRDRSQLSHPWEAEGSPGSVGSSGSSGSVRLGQDFFPPTPDWIAANGRVRWIDKDLWESPTGFPEMFQDLLIESFDPVGVGWDFSVP